MTLVLILPPVINGVPSVNDIAEPCSLRHSSRDRLLKLSINPFCAGLPSWIKRNSAPCSKAQWSSAHQVISGPRPCYRRRIAPKQCDTVRNTLYLKMWIPACGGNCQTLLLEVVYTGQALDSATKGQRVHDEIHWQGKVVCGGADQRLTLLCQVFTTPFAFYALAAEMIKALNALMINMKAFTVQQLPNAPLPKSLGSSASSIIRPDKFASTSGCWSRHG